MSKITSHAEATLFLLLVGALIVPLACETALALPDTEAVPNSTIQWKEQPSYEKEACKQRPPGTVCAAFRDDYVLLVEDSIVGWGVSGQHEGRLVQVAYGSKADYLHVLKTNLVVVSSKANTRPQPEAAQAKAPGSLPAQSAGGAMVLTGRAGYRAGALGPQSPEAFRSVFVGAWRKTWRGTFCAQALSDASGSFRLEVPDNGFEDGEPIYITAGGLTTCVTIPFHAGTTAGLDVYGQKDPKCE